MIVSQGSPRQVTVEDRIDKVPNRFQLVLLDSTSSSVAGNRNAHYAGP